MPSTRITFAHGAAIPWGASYDRYGDDVAAARKLEQELHALVQRLSPTTSPRPSLRWLDENINVVTPCLPGRVEAALQPVLEQLKTEHGFTLPGPSSPFLSRLDEFFQRGAR